MWPSVWLFRHGPVTAGTSVFATSWKSCGPYRLATHLCGSLVSWHAARSGPSAGPVSPKHVHKSAWCFYDLTPEDFRHCPYSQTPLSQRQSDRRREEKGWRIRKVWNAAWKYCWFPDSAWRQHGSPEGLVMSLLCSRPSVYNWSKRKTVTTSDCSCYSTNIAKQDLHKRSFNLFSKLITTEKHIKTKHYKN